MSASEEQRQKAEELALQILDEVLNPEPVTEEEIRTLNSKHGFSTRAIFELLEKRDKLKAHRDNMPFDYAYTDKGESEFVWLRDFSRYTESDEYNRRIAQAIQEQKERHADKTPHIGKQAKVVSDIEPLRSFVPVKGTIGTVIDSEYRVDYQNPHKSSFFIRVEFSLPLMLIDNEILVNESILSEDDESVTAFLVEHPDIDGIWWQRENQDVHSMLFKASEIEII